MAEINWARKEAEAIVSYLPADKAAAIDYVAAALQRVADECADIAKKHRLRNNRCERNAVTSDEHRAYENRLIGCIEVEDGIRARFPKEEK